MTQTELPETEQSLFNLLADGLSATHVPYPEYRDHGFPWLDPLPAHWKLRRLKFIARVQPSNVDKKTVDGELAVQLCNYVDVYKNEFITPDLDFMQATVDLAELNKFRLRRGDVLITKDSEEWNDIAIPAYVTQDFDDVVCGYHLARVRPFPAIVDGEYLARAFKSGGVTEQFQVSANGVTRFGISAGALGDVLFPLPPIQEQLGIARFLADKTSRIDALIAGIPLKVVGDGVLVRFSKLLREYRFALITAAVTGRIDVRNVPSRREA